MFIRFLNAFIHTTGNICAHTARLQRLTAGVACGAMAPSHARSATDAAPAGAWSTLATGVKAPGLVANDAPLWAMQADVLVGIHTANKSVLGYK